VLSAGLAGSLSFMSGLALSGGSARGNSARVVRSPAATAKRVIVIFNCGAPSHIDLWDPKPLASDNVRGEFSPIDTNVPGIQISELLPELAQRTDKLAIIRSVHHQHGAHNAGMYWSTVGRPYPIDSTLINPSRADYPGVPTLISWLADQQGYDLPLPGSVIVPRPHCDSFVYLTPGQFGGCLGPKYDPLVLNSDPNSPKFSVPDLGPLPELGSARINDRLSLVEAFDRPTASTPFPQADELSTLRNKAASLLTSTAVSRAFDLSQEPDAVRDRYGRHMWGQSHLLARRLSEAGVPVVTAVNGDGIIWDTHKDNFNGLKKRLVPPMQRAYVALLDDLEERGLLDETLVVWMGDFGRTPIINKDVGRDHWPQCYTMVLAGGGIRGGQVVGASDAQGAVPVARPVSPADVHATIFQALGYDSAAIHYLTADGRPTPVSEGSVIRELL
jgi:hypothetical protein